MRCGVLIGTGDPVDSVPPRGVMVAERVPHPGRLGQQLKAQLALEGVVPGDRDVTDDRVGDVCGDVKGGGPGRPVRRALGPADGAPRKHGPSESKLAGTLGGHRQGAMAPPKRMRDGLRGSVGQHRQDEGLGVPKRVAVVPAPGQALGWDGASLGPGPGLQDVKQRKAHGLLDLGGALDLDVGALPEIVQIATLLLDQAIPAGLGRRREGGGDLVAHRRLRADRGPAIGDELDDLQSLTGLEGRRDGHAAEIGEALRRHLHGGRPLDVVVHGGTDPQVADRRAVQQGRASVPAGVGRRVQRGLEYGRHPGVAAREREGLIGHQFGLDHHPHTGLERLDLVGDGGHRALDQRHEARRAHADTTAVRRHPLDDALQEAGPEVQKALVGTYLAVADVEGLVVDEEADQLAVGDVDHRLPVFGVAETRLGVGQRAGLVDAVEV
jgi:hypothetical protein